MTMSKGQAGKQFGAKPVVPQPGAQGAPPASSLPSRAGNRYETTKAVGPASPTYKKSVRLRVPDGGESNTGTPSFRDPDPKSKHKF